MRGCIESKLQRIWTITRCARAEQVRGLSILLLVGPTAHAIGSDIEEAIRAVAPGLEVTVHIEPLEDRAAWE